MSVHLRIPQGPLYPVTACGGGLGEIWTEHAAQVTCTECKSHTIKETSAKVWSPCPKCAGWVPEETVWIFEAKFYCSEKCAREASQGR